MDTIEQTTILCDLEQMEDLAQRLSKKIKPSSCITISGDLGAGKTTFVRFLCKNLAKDSIVSSPTYSYLNIYDDSIAHFDLYRIKTKEQFFSLGLEEYIDSDFITLIEWPEIITDILPSNTIEISILHKDNKREIQISGISI